MIDGDNLNSQWYGRKFVKIVSSWLKQRSYCIEVKNVLLERYQNPNSKGNSGLDSTHLASKLLSAGYRRALE